MFFFFVGGGGVVTPGNTIQTFDRYFNLYYKAENSPVVLFL